MPSTKVRAIVSFIFLAVFATACSSEHGTANENTTPFPKRQDNSEKAANNNAEELALLIELPFEPTEVVWREIRLGTENSDRMLPSQNERRLVAVLRFDPADVKKLAGSAGKLREPTEGSIDVEQWFPKELLAKSEIDAEAKLAGNIYAADSFFRSPYLSGTLTHLDDTDYFVLDLTAR